MFFWRGLHASGANIVNKKILVGREKKLNFTRATQTYASRRDSFFSLDMRQAVNNSKKKERQHSGMAAPL